MILHSVSDTRDKNVVTFSYSSCYFLHNASHLFNMLAEVLMERIPVGNLNLILSGSWQLSMHWNMAQKAQLI